MNLYSDFLWTPISVHEGIKNEQTSRKTPTVRSRTFCLAIRNTSRVHQYTYVCRFQNVVLRFPAPRLHCSLSSHWSSFRFLSFMAFLIPSIQFFFGLPRALFCFGIHFNAIMGNLLSPILWTWPYHVSWFCSISFIIVSSNPICCPVVTFLILSFLDLHHLNTRAIFADSLRARKLSANMYDIYHCCVYSEKLLMMER